MHAFSYCFACESGRKRAMRTLLLGLILVTFSCGDNKGQLTPDAKVDASIDSTADANSPASQSVMFGASVAT